MWGSQRYNAFEIYEFIMLRILLSSVSKCVYLFRFMRNFVYSFSPFRLAPHVLESFLSYLCLSFFSPFSISVLQYICCPVPSLISRNILRAQTFLLYCSANAIYSNVRVEIRRTLNYCIGAHRVEGAWKIAANVGECCERNANDCSLERLRSVIFRSPECSR